MNLLTTTEMARIERHRLRNRILGAHPEDVDTVRALQALLNLDNDRLLDRQGRPTCDECGQSHIMLVRIGISAICPDCLTTAFALVRQVAEQPDR